MHANGSGAHGTFGPTITVDTIEVGQARERGRLYGIPSAEYRKGRSDHGTFYPLRLVRKFQRVEVGAGQHHVVPTDLSAHTPRSPSDRGPTPPAQGRRPCGCGVRAHPRRGSRGDRRHDHQPLTQATRHSQGWLTSQTCRTEFVPRPPLERHLVVADRQWRDFPLNLKT
jgi:hypothetical protein